MMGAEENAEIEVLPENTGEIELVQEEVLQCCIGECGSKHEPSTIGVISFHKVPKQPFGARQAWINVIRESRNDPEWIPDDNSAVCSKHFRSDDLIKIPGTKRVVLDLESCPNIVPCLRLGIKVKSPEGAQANGDDEVNVVAADPGITFLPLRIKQEPRSEEEDNDTNDKSEEFLEDDPEITPSTRPKKVKRTPKPTWSLKELSDDEGARDGYGSDSSDYEPTSSSDSDSDREKSSSSTSKRARLAHSGQPGQRSNGSLSSHRITNSTQSSGNGKGPSFANLKISPGHVRPVKNANSNSGGVQQKHVPHILNMICWVEEMANVNRSAPSEALYYSTCMSRLEKILQCLKYFPSSDFKSELEKHFQGLVGVVKQRNSEGQSMANKVHFSLVSKKALEILRDAVGNGLSAGRPASVTSQTPKQNSVIPGSRPMVPRRLVPSLVPASATSLKGSTAPRPQVSRPSFVLSSSSGQVSVKSANSVIPDAQTVRPGTIPSVEPKPANPEVVTLDDDNDDGFVPTIQSVQTLASSTSSSVSAVQQRRPSLIARTFSQFVQNVLSSEVPPPLPDEQAESVPWMGVRTEDKIDEEYDPGITRSILATVPIYPRGKFPPNVTVTLKKPAVQPVDFNRFGTVVNQNGIVGTIFQPSILQAVSIPQKLPVLEGHGGNGMKVSYVPAGSVPGSVLIQAPIANPVQSVLPSATLPTTTPRIISAQPKAAALNATPNQTRRNSKSVEEVIVLSDSDEEVPSANIQRESAALAVSNEDSILGI